MLTFLLFFLILKRLSSRILGGFISVFYHWQQTKISQASSITVQTLISIVLCPFPYPACLLSLSNHSICALWNSCWLTFLLSSAAKLNLVGSLKKLFPPLAPVNKKLFFLFLPFLPYVKGLVVGLVSSQTIFIEQVSPLATVF